MQARTQVRRIGVNLNQAAAILNATGAPPPWLQRATTLADRAIGRLDAAATEVTALARHDRATGRTRPASRPDNRADTGGQS